MPAILSLACLLTGCDWLRSKPRKTTTAETTGQRTVPLLMGKRPKFACYKAYVLNNGSDTTFIRVVANSKILQKVWLVYFDHDKDDWVVKSWQGTGTGNHLIADTALLVQKYQADLYQTTDVYMAYSADEGKTWQSHNPTVAYLNCTDDPRLDNHVQLLLPKDDLLNGSNFSLAVLLQWRKPKALSGGEVYGYDLSAFCRLKKTF